MRVQDGTSSRFLTVPYRCFGDVRRPQYPQFGDNVLKPLFFGDIEMGAVLPLMRSIPGLLDTPHPHAH